MVEFYRRMYNNLSQGNRVTVVTITGCTKNNLIGSKLLYGSKGIFTSRELPEDIKRVGVELMQGISEKEQPVLVKKSVNGTEVDFFVEIIFPVPKVIILGCGHVSQAVATMLSNVGFSVTVVDDRSEFATRDRFPQADKILCSEFDKALDSLKIDSNTYIIIITRGHLHDYKCLEKVLDSNAKYIGMIGSRRKVKLHKEKLATEGFSQEKIASIYAPIGLDIGAETPEEIAVSITAELIAVRRGKIDKLRWDSDDS